MGLEGLQWVWEASVGLGGFIEFGGPAVGLGVCSGFGICSGFAIRLSPSLRGSHAGCPVVNCVWHSCDLPSNGCVRFMHFFWPLSPKCLFFFHRK